MTRLFVALFALLLIIIGAVLLIPANETEKRQTRVCFENSCFFVEVALTPMEREKGLMFRNYLARDGGMLFIFDKEGEYSFWMKNTLISLDIIWLNENKEVVFTAENNPPCLQNVCPLINPSGRRAKYVLELNGGSIEKIGLNVRDKMDVEF